MDAKPREHLFPFVCIRVIRRFRSPVLEPRTDANLREYLLPVRADSCYSWIPFAPAETANGRESPRISLARSCAFVLFVDSVPLCRNRERTRIPANISCPFVCIRVIRGFRSPLLEPRTDANPREYLLPVRVHSCYSWIPFPSAGTANGRESPRMSLSVRVHSCYSWISFSCAGTADGRESPRMSLSVRVHSCYSWIPLLYHPTAQPSLRGSEPPHSAPVSGSTATTCPPPNAPSHGDSGRTS